jgi:hypothetical protein
MGMFGANKITGAGGNVVATGKDGNDDDPQTLQISIDQDNGLMVGAIYTITKPDGTGYQGIVYTGNDGDTIYDFNYGSATPF